MRVAVLADIHGHLPALDAALADIDAAGGAGPKVDRIVLNGDIATGPMPAETLDRLAALGDRAVWVRGNADRELVAAYDGHLDPALPPEVAEPTRFAAGRLRPDHRDLLAGLPLTVTLDVDGLGPTLFCHATARGDEEIVLVDSPVEAFRQAFSAVPAAVATVVLGHTHMPFDRLADRRRYVNPGSLGMPYGVPGAHWALLGPDVVLRRTPYDPAAAAAVLAATGYPGVEEFLAENVRTVPSDAEALAVFSPRAV
jgi:predicted phosphodiesterase